VVARPPVSATSALPRIHYARPSITELEERCIAQAAADGWGDNAYHYLERFEVAFRLYLGVEYSIATSSGTGALHLGMAGLGIGPGDEVILADINWVASAAPIVHLGARPVFVDVLRDSWCLDPESVELAMTDRTKAILAVHLYGNLCDMDALESVGRKHGVPVIEDAAEAIGSSWGRTHAGTRGAFGAFSFHASKTITTGEGGMFVTSDPALYGRVLTLSHHGRTAGEARQFWPSTVGFKYRLSDLQASLGCAQLERVADLLAGKRRVFEYYRDALKDAPVRMNPEPPGTTNGYWMPTIVADSERFDQGAVLAEFRRSNIDGRTFFYPLTMTPPFRAEPKNRVSYDLYSRAICLPSYYDLGDSDMDRVLAALLPALR
jgi:perosamine synthetase